jgi:hypothetical protein
VSTTGGALRYMGHIPFAGERVVEGGRSFGCVAFEIEDDMKEVVYDAGRKERMRRT